jgi:hypothetical protein
MWPITPYQCSHPAWFFCGGAMTSPLFYNRQLVFVQ